jgi:cadmium resistance protein CadD (predicted permease)
MRKISYWAKRNPRNARVIIIISHVLILLLAWYTGTKFINVEIFLPGYLLLVFIILYGVAVIVYPRKKERNFFNRRFFYIKQKTCNFFLAFAAYGMIICIANGNVRNQIVQPAFGITAASTVIDKIKPTAAEILASLKYRDKKTLSREEKRILKKEFRLQLKNYVIAKVTGNKRDGEEAGLILLSIVGALGLLFLVTALACNLSCNGYDGAAAIVGILGVAGIIIGLIVVIKAINRKAKKKKEDSLKNGSNL